MKAMNRVIGPEIVIDTGIVVEYLEGSEVGKKIKDLIFMNEFVVSVLATPVLAIELHELLSKKSTTRFATSTIKKLKEIITIVPLKQYVALSGEIKASMELSLSDSCTLGLAVHKSINAVFKREKEIEKNVKKHGKNEYSNRIVFIDDFQVFKNGVVVKED